MFSRQLWELARKAQQSIGQPYNGVHLRVEPDAIVWNHVKDQPGLIAEYVKAMNAAGFEAHVPIYIASGLLFRGPTKGASSVPAPCYKQSMLKAESRCPNHTLCRIW